MTRRMLINAREPQELRIAVVDGSTLDSYQVEVAESGLTRGNIYRAVVVGIQPNLNAAFIDYGADRHGFLSVQDVAPEAYHRKPPSGTKGRPRIDQVLEKGRPLTVQVEREALQSKGAVLTTFLSLAGRYLVLTPFDSTRGVSRKVEDDDTRRRLKELAGGLNLPTGCGVIVRTNALDQTKRDLNRDLNALLRVWRQVTKEERQSKKPKLIYSDQNLILRTLRDTLDSSVKEILVDDDKAIEQASQYLKAFLPRTKIKLQRYDDPTPLFARYKLESQIERIYERKVPLPGGGSIVIDPTEALVAIDVNSGRTSGGSGEETALNTNLEAAREVARQLRLRDIGGLVVVDFIDMRSKRNQRNVEKELKDALKDDKARAYVGRISPNGLLEINRQRIQQELRLRSQQPCPTCDGTGRIPSSDILGLNIMRRIRAAAAAGHGKNRVQVRLHPETAAAFQNSRRSDLLTFEEEFGVTVEVVPAHHLHRPESELEWLGSGNGGRRHSSPQPLVDAAQLAIAESARGGRGSRTDSDSGDGDGVKSQSRSSRSRRGRRGRGKSAAAKSAEGKQAAGSSPSDTSKGEAAADQDSGKPAKEAAEGGDKKPPRRRRRRRRRRSGGKSSPASPTESG